MRSRLKQEPVGLSWGGKTGLLRKGRRRKGPKRTILEEKLLEEQAGYIKQNAASLTTLKKKRRLRMGRKQGLG